MDIVSFETSVQLKANGFPQPNPEFGQMWYVLPGFDDLGRIDSFDLVVVISTSENTFESVGLTGNVYSAITRTWQMCYDPKNRIYAPMAADILRELPYTFSTRFNGSDFEVEPDQYPEIKYMSDKLSEAAAAARLEENKKL